LSDLDSEEAAGERTVGGDGGEDSECWLEEMREGQSLLEDREDIADEDKTTLAIALFVRIV
jgi:hypothetical protein